MINLLKLNIVRRSLFRRRHSAEAMRECEARFRAVVNTVPVTVYEFRRTSAGRSFTFVSPQILELTGIGASEMLANAGAFYDLIHPDDLDAMLAASELAVATVSRFSHEFRIVKPDGKIRWISANSLPQERGEGDSAWVGCLQDITGSKLAEKPHREIGEAPAVFTDSTEQEFVRNGLGKLQKLESFAVLSGELAHDFNNILLGVMGNISFAQISLDGDHPARLPLQAAEKAALRAAALARKLLLLAKGGESVKQVISVEHLLGEALSLFLRGTNVQGRLFMPAALHAIEADEGEMNQAFDNLVINAAHAMTQGGRLTVSGENVLLEGGNALSLAAGSYVKLVFEDEGCGIPEAYLKRIFDIYFTTKAGGTGLGLASTLAIVRRHGGDIQVRSQVDVGTTFTLYLPAAGDKLSPSAGHAGKHGAPVLFNQHSLSAVRPAAVTFCAWSPTLNCTKIRPPGSSR
jgi:PAS domain S-box-containing protein